VQDAEWVASTRAELDEALLLARAQADLETEANCLWGLSVKSVAGGMPDMGDYLDQFDRLLEEYPHPLFPTVKYIVRAIQSLVMGDYPGAVDWADSLIQAARARGRSDADVYFTLTMFQLLRETHGLGVLVDTLLELRALEAEGRVPGARSGLAAWALAEAGRADEARRLLEENGQNGFSDMPDDAGLPIAMTAWAEAAALLRDKSACRALYDRLLPFHDVHQWTGCWYSGSTARYLALLAVALSDEADADRWFIQAIEDHRRIGSPSWLARTRIDWAEHLVGRDEVERACDMARAALDDIGSLELTVSRNRANAVLESTA